MKREKSLDGIRGLMELNVVICHFVCVYYPEMYYAKFTGTSEILRLFAWTPLSVLINGNVAVQYFFVLSGYLTAMSIFNSAKKTPKQLLQKSVNRYFRLLPMVFAATAFAYLLMEFGLMFHLDIASSVKNSAFIASYNNFTPTFTGFLADAFIMPFIKSSSYVGPFWTIRYELFGYILCLVVCTIFKDKKYRRICYILIELLLCVINIKFYYLFPFVLGVYIADFRCFREPDTAFLSKYYNKILYSNGFLIVIGIIGTYLATIPTYYAGIHKILGVIPAVPTGMYRAVGVALLLYVFLFKKPFASFLESKLIQWLGKISFPIYAFHWPLMLSFQAFLFGKLIEASPYDAAALISFTCSFILILAVSYIAWLAIEKTKLSDLLTRAIKKKKVQSNQTTGNTAN